MRIQPASFDQLLQARNGRWHLIDSDVGSVAQRVDEIARSVGAEFHLEVSDITGVYRVVQIIGSETQVVTTAQQCDHRIVDSLLRCTSESFNLGDEIEKDEAEKDREFYAEQADKIGDIGERLAHALRKDLGPVI